MSHPKEAAEGHGDAQHEPHVFQQVDLMPGSMPTGNRGSIGMFAPPPTPASKSVVCGVCKQPRSHHLHIEGQAAADSESPRWGM